MAYSKGAFAESLGISRGELERKAKDAGFDTTEAFFNATGGTGQMPGDAARPAVEALDQFSATLQAGLPGQIAEVESAGQQDIRDIETERARQEEAFGLQRQRAQETKEGDIASTRRRVNEIMQGLQARFGTTTGTGAFAGELAGREALRSIAGSEQAFQAASQELDLAQNALARRVTDLLENTRVRVAEQKERIRRELKERLAEVNVRKGELESQKASERMQLMQRARELMLAQEESQRQFERDLQLQAQQQANNLEIMREEFAMKRQNIGNQLASNIDFSGFGANISTPQEEATAAALSGATPVIRDTGSLRLNTGNNEAGLFNWSLGR